MCSNGNRTSDWRFRATALTSEIDQLNRDRSAALSEVRFQRNGRGALAALALMLVGCDGQGPQAEPPPAPGIGQLEGDIFYFHNDRLGTPVRLTNELGVTVWRADYRPFGDVERLETDVDGDRVHIEQPLRFPGQYEDALSGLILAQGPYYNWNRHYEPATGRYFSPEPLLQRPEWVLAELKAGLGVPGFAYALDNPAFFTDPDGLQVPAVDSPTAVCSRLPHLCAILGLAATSTAARTCEGANVTPKPKVEDPYQRCSDALTSCGRCCKMKVQPVAPGQYGTCVTECTAAFGLCMAGKGQLNARCWPGSGSQNPGGGP